MEYKVETGFVERNDCAFETRVERARSRRSAGKTVWPSILECEVGPARHEREIGKCKRIGWIDVLRGDPGIVERRLATLKQCAGRSVQHVYDTGISEEHLGGTVGQRPGQSSVR